MIIKGNWVFYIKSPNSQFEKVINVSFLKNNFWGVKKLFKKSFIKQPKSNSQNHPKSHF